MICLRQQLRLSHGGVLSSGGLLWAGSRRSLLTLAIETSCDDTSVAILERRDGNNKPLTSLSANDSADDSASPGSLSVPRATLHFHEKITSDNTKFGGVHPVESLKSHQKHLALLISKALHHLPCAPPNASLQSTIPFLSSTGILSTKLKPNFISVTRGPGMRSSLSAGLDTAKGLATAWQIPLLGIHHMQAHALTPRLVAELSSPSQDRPSFPFLSLLVSGGHTLLLHSISATAHKQLATTEDIALGGCLDKSARAILPPSLRQTSTSHAPLLEPFVFGPYKEYNYTAPATRHEEMKRYESEYRWSISPPMAGSKQNSMEYSYSGLESTILRIVNGREDDMEAFPLEERKLLARELMRIAFEHLGSRVVLALRSLSETEKIGTLVVSGGVAANGFLRHLLQTFLAARGYGEIELVCPPMDLCTDNAAMIAWVGMEMWKAGWESEMRIRAIRKWPMEDVLGVEGWRRRV